MELNEEVVKKAMDWIDSLVGNSNDSDIAMFTYQLLGVLYDTCEELTKDNKRLSKQCGEIIVECDERDAERLMQIAELTEENERLRNRNITLEQKFVILNREEVPILTVKVEGE